MKNIFLVVTFILLVISVCWTYLAIDALQQLGCDGLQQIFIVGVGVIFAINAPEIARRITRWIAGDSTV